MPKLDRRPTKNCPLDHGTVAHNVGSMRTMANPVPPAKGHHSSTNAAPNSSIVTAMRAALLDATLTDDQRNRSAAEWDEAATFMAQVAEQRIATVPAIQLETVSGTAGARHMRLGIANDDMPFLVDSVAGAIEAAGLQIDYVIHPILALRRDDAGLLIATGASAGAGAARESLIYIEMERADAKARHKLLEDIQSVLADVRAAVADWAPMQAAMRADAERLGDGEGADLLHWLLDRNFTQLGHEHILTGASEASALGICRSSATPMLSSAARKTAMAWFAQGGHAPLIVKSNVISTVHRRVLIDLIILPIWAGEKISGMSIHAGMWTSAALSAPPETVPIIRAALAHMMAKHAFDPSSHAGKALVHVLTNLPHDLLVAADPDQFEALALTAMSIAERPRPKLQFLLAPLQRHLFAFVWMPRDEVSTNRRTAIADLLMARANAQLLGWSIAMEDGGAALLRYTLDLRNGGVLPDVEAMNAEIEAMVRGWAPGIEAALSQLGEEGRANALAHRYAGLFPQAYRLNHLPAEAAADILRVRLLDDDHAISVRITSAHLAEPFRLKVYSAKGALPLSGVVPVLENFGFVVLEESPTALEGAIHGDMPGHIHDFLLEMKNVSAGGGEGDDRITLIENAVADVLADHAENDAFNQLIVSAGLPLPSVGWIRAWFRYLRQAGMPYGLPTMVQALRGAPDVTRAIVNLFITTHNLHALSVDGAATQRATIAAGLEQVSAIDDDRILRLLTALVEAVLRTNAFAPAAAEALAFKLDSAAIPNLPRPLPWREIFVYSARVEGIHLRAGPVARGGLRWSDRRDDFRTEILGLMKAQRVKNAVIVPTGAKGGFYPKALPDPVVNRDAWLAEGTECYRIFIRSLLSITDNLDGDTVVHPAQIVVRDGPDPYFVVAADKGTASFSDIANAIALDADFWLGDAFASGGSNGYDHKAMGITAKGAWLSVQRHFMEMGTDIQADPVRVAGVGDMSGDVFGNGMLLSKSLKLIAAFDHRHIFIDPNPDAASSWAERARLFALPRSSWADYDTKLISKGGAVYPRSQKSITLSPEACAALGLDGAEVDPTQLMTAILTAPVDLLWFGGIGTYVKAAAQNNADVGDPANDRLRVDAEAVRARVIGEGANLGITQAARIAFSQKGGRINTDFIDNSAGVDCSDNEVNIKIALNKEVREGRLGADARNTMLSAMTDDVAALVLADNRAQALALSIAERGGVRALPSIIRLIERFESEGRLDRKVEGLASNDELLRRAQDLRGLTRPELAVILSTAKLAIQQDVEAAGLGRDALMEGELLAAFPHAMVEQHRTALLAHQLRNEIVATKVANRLINRMGLVHPFELAEEEGVGMGEVAAAFVVAEQLFGLAGLWAAIDDADVAEQVRLTLYEEVAVELRAHMADLIRNAVTGRSLQHCVEDLRGGIALLDGKSDQLLRAQGREQINAFAQRLEGLGTPPDLARAIVHLAEVDGAVGIVSLAQRKGQEPLALTRAFTALGQASGVDWAQGAAMQLSPTDPWERLLVAGLARDFQQMRLETLARLSGVEAGGAAGDPEAAAAAWLLRNDARVQQFRAFVDRARNSPAPSPAMLAQLAGQARGLFGRD